MRSHRDTFIGRRTRGLLALGWSIPVSLALLADAHAAGSTSRGWMVGMDLGGTAITFRDAPTEGGGIVGARVGYGVTRTLAPYFSMYESDVATRFTGFDKVTFGHVDLGLRLHLANPDRRWVPYGDLAMTLWFATDVLQGDERSTTDFASSPTITIGAGLAMFLSPSWALDANFRAAAGLFEDVEVGDLQSSGAHDHVHTFQDIEAASLRLTLGVSWWPRGSTKSPATAGGRARSR